MQETVVCILSICLGWFAPAARHFTDSDNRTAAQSRASTVLRKILGYRDRGKGRFMEG